MTFRSIVAWVILFACVLTGYLLNYKKPDYHPDLMTFVTESETFFAYILIYLGNPLCLSGRISEAICWGFVGIFLFGGCAYLVYLKKDFKEVGFHSFFLIIGCYSILCAILTAVGRAGFGSIHAMASRYMSVSILLWISIFAMILSGKFETVLESEKKRVTVRRFGAFILFIFFIIFNCHSVRNFEGRSLRSQFQDVRQTSSIEQG